MVMSVIFSGVGRTDAHVVLDSEFVQPMRDVLILIKGANATLVQSGRKTTRRSTHEIFQVFDGVIVRGQKKEFGALSVEPNGLGGKVGDYRRNLQDSVDVHLLEVIGALLKMGSPMEEPVARAFVESTYARVRRRK